MAKLKPKPVNKEFEAWQWRGFVPVEGLDLGLQTSYEKVSSSIEYIMDFEAWAKKHLKGMKIRYRGNDLVIPDPDYGEKVLKPGQWIVMIPDEYDTPQMNFLTNEQVKSSYDADRL